MSSDVLTLLLAVALAALGAVFFGLAAVRQHGAVQESVSPAATSVREQVQSALRLMRQRSWLIGTGQAGLGGSLHIAALALAPITVVQPIGVLAVPVTVIGTAARTRQRPRRRQWAGVALSVAGISGLTVLLVALGSTVGRVPAVRSLLAGLLGVLGGSLLLALAARRMPPLLRCVALAVAAAALFGLNSVLIRTVGQVVVSGGAGAFSIIVIISIVGILCALPLGVWFMQTAYLSGPPQVVICCLTLMDPVTAVIGGRLLLRDGGPITGTTLVVALGCAVVTAAGVVLLSRDYPAETAVH